MGAFKPANRSPDVRGLYLAGGAAHPGPGMPMVLMSGWIAADALDRDVKRPRAAERCSEAGQGASGTAGGGIGLPGRRSPAVALFSPRSGFMAVVVRAASRGAT